MRRWDDKMDNLLRRHYPKGDIATLAARLGRTQCAVANRARALGIRRRSGKHKPWTKRDIANLRRLYADNPASVVAEKTRHGEKAVYNMAHALGLTKSGEYRSAAGRKLCRHENSVATRFRKGRTPENKGKREQEFRSPEAIERCRRTQFKPGRKPHNAKPVGYESVNKDGYVMVKAEGEGKMVPKHRLVWRQAHGEIPRGCIIAFKDGNRLNCELDNLCMISREDAARLRIERETEEQRRARVDKATATRKKMIARDRLRLHWGLEPYSKMVKKW